MGLLGSNPFAVILCTLADQPAQPQPPSWFQGFIGGPTGLNGYWTAVSNGQFNLDGTQVFGWRAIPQNQADFSKLSRPDQIGACRAAFPDVDFSGFFGVVAMVTGTANWGASGRDAVFDQTSWNITTVAHETGHCLGLGHSFDDSAISYSVNNDGWAGAYGDGWDIMSASTFAGANPTYNGPFGPRGPALSGPYRDQLGWIPTARIFETRAPVATTITLAALNHPEAPGYLLAKVYVSPDESQYYTVELRRKEGEDQGIPQDAVLIHMVKNGRSYLIRADGGPQRLAGSTYVDRANTPNVRIGVTSISGATSTAAVAIATSALGPAVSGRPATLAAENQQHAFYRGRDGNLYQVLWDPDSGLRSEQWAGPGGPIAAPPAAGNPATLAADNQQHAFYRGPDGAIYQAYWTPGAGLRWDRWAGPGSPSGAPPAGGDPATLLAEGQQHVFYRGLDQNVYQVLRDADGSQHFEQWAGPGSPTGAPPAAGNPATMAANNQQHIFYRDTANNLQHVFWGPGAGQQKEQWAGPGSLTGAPPAVGDPAALTATKQQHVFYRASDGNLYHVFWDPVAGLTAQPWAGPASPVDAPAPTGDPAALAANGQVHVFYRGGNNGIHHVFWDPPSGLHKDQWAGPGSPKNAPMAAGDPATLAANDQQHIFYRDFDDELVHVFGDSAAGLRWGQWAGRETGKVPPPPAVGDPATMVAEGQQHIFYRNMAEDVIHVLWDPAGGIRAEQWAGRLTAAGGAVSNIATMVADNQQHIFYRDSAGEMLHVFWDAGGLHADVRWAGPTSNVPAAGAATMVANGQQHIFYRGVDKNIYHVFWDAGSGPHTEPWAGPVSPTGAPPANGDPATMVAEGQQHIFYRDTSNNIFHVYWDPDAGQQKEQWAGPGSPTGAPTAGSDPAVMVASNQQHIFYRDTSGNIQHVFWDPGTGQHLEQWAGPGSPTGAPPAAGKPATLAANNQQHIFYRDVAGNLQHVFWDPGSGQHLEQWAGPGSPTGAPPAAGEPATMVAEGQQHVFYRGGDNNVYHVYWDPGSGLHWEHWTIGLPGWVPPWP